MEYYITCRYYYIPGSMEGLDMVKPPYHHTPLVTLMPSQQVGW